MQLIVEKLKLNCQSKVLTVCNNILTARYRPITKRKRNQLFLLLQTFVIQAFIFYRALNRNRYKTNDCNTGPKCIKARFSR